MILSGALVYMFGATSKKNLYARWEMFLMLSARYIEEKYSYACLTPKSLSGDVERGFRNCGNWGIICR